MWPLPRLVRDLFPGMFMVLRGLGWAKTIPEVEPKGFGGKGFELEKVIIIIIITFIIIIIVFFITIPTLSLGGCGTILGIGPVGLVGGGFGLGLGGGGG